MPFQSPEPITLYEGQLTTTPTLAYTAPRGLVVTVEAVSLVNITGTAATARIDHVPANSSDGTTLEAFNGSVGANLTVELPLTGAGPVLVLQPGDEVYVSAGTATAIDCQIFGSESPIE